MNLTPNVHTMKIDSDFLSLFEYRALTKINGEPTYESLKRLKEQLKANATKIISNIGGGQHGHLGLVKPLEYGNASAIPYVRPPPPVPLVIQPSTTARQENTIREDYKKATELFHETVNLKQTLKARILEAIHKECTLKMTSQDAGQK